MKKDELSIISWILRGSQRRVIFEILNKNKIPAQIYSEAVKINSKITRNSVSDILREFKRKGLVKCINPYEKKGRIYQLTTLGNEIKDKI